jgi:hypothetical protein
MTGFIMISAYSEALRTRDTVPEFDRGDAFILFCWCYVRFVLDPVSAATAWSVPLHFVGDNATAHQFYYPGYHRWYLYWMLFNKTVRVVGRVVENTPSTDVDLTNILLYFLLRLLIYLLLLLHRLLLLCPSFLSPPRLYEYEH